MRLRGGAGGRTVAGLALAALAAPAVASAAPNSVTFTTTGEHEIVVPSGVTTFDVVAIGGYGGDGDDPGGAGGDPARVAATLSGLTPGGSLFVVVAGNGADGEFRRGGGGGGATDLRTCPRSGPCPGDTLASRLLVAAGGGGGGGGAIFAAAGDGGDAGEPGEANGRQGQPGAFAAGGAGGPGTDGAGLAGVLGVGGRGGDGTETLDLDVAGGFNGGGDAGSRIGSGGGGGGGHHGGGGGGAHTTNGGGGGGGGSSFVVGLTEPEIAAVTSIETVLGPRLGITFEDVVAPVLTLDAPASGTRTSDAGVEVDGTAGTGLGDGDQVTVEWRQGAAVVDSEVVTAAPDGSFSASASPLLPEGVYTVTARQVDGAGNEGVSNAVVVTLDTTPPSPALVTPADGTLTNDATPLLSGVAGTATGDSPDVVQVWIRDGGPGGPVLSVLIADPDDVTGAFAVTSPALADGVYTSQAVQLDDVGNMGDSAPVTFTVDATAPETSIVSGPVHESSTFDRSPVLGFSSSEPGGGFECRFDGGPVVACDGGTFAPAGPLGDGEHRLDVAAVDAAGNRDPSPAVRIFTVRTPPGPPPLFAAPFASPVTPAPTLRLDLQGDRPQLLTEKRDVSVILGCGPVACTMQVDASVSASRTARAAARRLRGRTVRLEPWELVRVRLRTTRALRRAVRRALRRGRTVTVRVRIRISAPGQDAVTRRASVGVRLPRGTRGA